MNYLVLAMKRSGSHCLINWLQAFTRLPFYNNTCFGWSEKKLLTMRGKTEAKEGIALIEDFNPDYWKEYDFPSFPFLKDCKVIVLTRSLKNWLASCYARKFQGNEERKDVYKFLKYPYTNDSKLKSPSRIDVYCKLSDFTLNSFVMPVIFDIFVKDRWCRVVVAKQLKLKWDEQADGSIRVPSKHGGGSSFSGLKHDTNVLNRDKAFKDDSEFHGLLKYAENKINKIGKSNVLCNK